jgi:hypothetical protein
MCSKIQSTCVPNLSRMTVVTAVPARDPLVDRAIMNATRMGTVDWNGKYKNYPRIMGKTF